MSRAVGPRPALVLRAGALGLLLALAAPTPASTANVPRGIDPRTPLSDLVLRRWTTADGLPTNVLVRVQQTPPGDLWIAGFGGLARFDGIEFEVFNQTIVPELAASSFYGVLADGEVLWIATQDKGLWKIEDGRVEPLAPDQPLTSIRALLLDSSGRLWVGTAGQGALKMAGARLVAAGPPELAAVTVRALHEDRDGDIWLGTEARGLQRFADGGWEAPDHGSELAGASVTSLAEAAEGGLWVGTQSGLYRHRNGSWTGFPGLERVEIFDLAEDDYGSLWIAAEQGLYRRRAGSREFEHLPALAGHSLRSINSIAFDHEGSAWVSSYTGGLFRLREGKFRNYTRANGLSTERVNSLYEWREGKILVGGDLGAIDRIAGGEVTRSTLGGDLPEVRVRAFLEDSRGTLWISSYAGLLRVGAGEERLFTTASGLPSNQVRLAYEDSAGRLWVATRGGGLARRIDGGGFETLDTSDGLPSDFVLSLGEDAAGNLLIGTQRGLAVLTAGGDITTYAAEDGLPASLVFNTFVDDAGVVWMGTTGGLARLRDGRIATLTVRNGLPADSVYDYLEDDLGYAWMSTSRGVVRVEKAALAEFLDGARETLELELLDSADGMAESQCTGATRMLRTSDGELWVPTLRGIAVIDPRRVASNPVPPPVLIRRLTVDGQRVAGRVAGGEVVQVPPGSRRFEFSFAALSFQAPEKVRVRYRLEGFDRDWVDAGRQRRALYTGLPPGRFTFRVRAANNDGVWSTEDAVLGLRVQPHFYQTPAFFLLAAGALLAGPWSVYRWRVRVVRRRSRKLERLLAEQRRLEGERVQLIRQLEARNEQLEHLTYAISHDLKSPLFTIQGFLGLLDKDLRAGNEKRVEADLARIREAVGSMGRLLEELLKLWRMENAESRREEVELADLAHRALAGLQGLLSERRVEVRVAPELPRAQADPTQVMEVLQNLIENAARFMGEQPRPLIEIGCRRDGGESVIYVRDNGIGIDPRFHAKVFRIFERLDPSSQGTGLGLAIVKRVIDAHDGRIWIESEGEGRGTTFCFTLGPATPQEGAGRPDR